MYKRNYNLPELNSFFLFGPRQTGKSTIVKSNYPSSKTLSINLLDARLYRKFLANPEYFLDVVNATRPEQRYIFVDEVQRVPEILNSIQQIMDSGSDKIFIMTGSSARKLKSSGSNLLGGRAWSFHMFPMMHDELEDNNLVASHSLQEILSFGCLPIILKTELASAKREILRSYIDVYINQEISQEAITRKLDAFLRFFPIAAQMNGEQINAAKIASDAGISANLVSTYYEILTDTLLGHFLFSYHESERKRHKTKPKFYFFDTGVLRSAQQMLSAPILWPSFAAGKLFETLVINEAIGISERFRKDFRFSFLRTASDVEVDLIIETPDGKCFAIEIKSKESPQPADYAPGFNAMNSIRPNIIRICVCTAQFETVVEKIQIMPYRSFFRFLRDY